MQSLFASPSLMYYSVSVCIALCTEAIAEPGHTQLCLKTQRTDNVQAEKPGDEYTYQCQCMEQCPEPRTDEEVCGDDGHTYPSHCHLHREACRANRAIRILHRGSCLRECLIGNTSYHGGQLLADNAWFHQMFKPLACDHVYNVTSCMWTTSQPRIRDKKEHRLKTLALLFTKWSLYHSWYTVNFANNDCGYNDNSRIAT